MKKIILSFFTFLFSFQLFSQASKIPENADFWNDYPSEELADFLVVRLSDEELLAQIFMFGWAGEEPSALLNQWVSNKGLGSVKVFGWNTNNLEQVARSISSLQERSQERKYKIPLFVATDQEGGPIRHVKGETTKTPGNMAIGASQYPVDAYYSAFYISREIKALGINMNFAPTVDLYTNRDSSVINVRSFGEDPELVGQLGSAFVSGSIAAGVIPTAKHFPGHGDTSSDSHVKLPGVYIDWEEAEKRELVPYKYLISQNVPAIMSGHLLYPRIEEHPASLSRGWLHDILREKLGFKGLVITDDMQMTGAWGYAGSTSEAFYRAIYAGNDIILSSRTAELDEKLMSRNLDEMQNSPEFRQIVLTAARRVILAKLNYFKSGNAAPLYPEVARLKDLIPDKEGQKFFLSQACRSITAYKNGSLPYKKGNDKLLIVGPWNDKVTDEESEYFVEAKKRYQDFSFYKIDYQGLGPNSIDWNGNQLEYMASSYDTIIMYVPNEDAVKIALRLKKCGKKVIILTDASPVNFLSGFDFADTILFGYSYSNFIYKAFFAALNGEFSPEGTLPLN